MLSADDTCCKFWLILSYIQKFFYPYQTAQCTGKHPNVTKILLTRMKSINRNKPCMNGVADPNLYIGFLIIRYLGSGGFGLVPLSVFINPLPTSVVCW